jgi:hypothetical protein
MEFNLVSKGLSLVFSESRIEMCQTGVVETARQQSVKKVQKTDTGIEYNYHTDQR